MRYAIAILIAATLIGGAVVWAQDAKPPEKLVFHNKGIETVFTHATHIAREKGECATCHTKLWPQSTKEPLASSDGCKTCHKAEGRSFEMQGHCVQCHPNGTAKSGVAS